MSVVAWIIFVVVIAGLVLAVYLLESRKTEESGPDITGEKKIVIEFDERKRAEKDRISKLGPEELREELNKRSGFD